MNPYLVLGVPLNADDKTIRRAYLEAIKLAPPDHNPKRFQAVSAAFDQIRDESSRHRYALFDDTAPGDSPFDAFVGYLRLCPHHQPLPSNLMREFLRTCTTT
jgi:curved DNA-binding protein CbpA